MIRWICCAIMLLAIAGPIYAQTSAAARKQAESWFLVQTNPNDSSYVKSYLKRVEDLPLTRADLNVWEAAAKKEKVSHSSLIERLAKFKPFFDLKDQVVAEAAAKYTKRVEQIPANAIEEWVTLTGVGQFTAAISLTAEDGVFPGERFSDQGFRALVRRFK